MAPRELKLHGFVLDSQGSSYDSVIENGAETMVALIISIDNPDRFRYIFVAKSG